MAVDANESPDSDSSRPPQRSLGVLAPIRSSFSLQLAVAGLVFIAIGFVLGSGVWAGMLPIWGAALVVVGLGAYAFTHLSQRGSKG
ncbi:hypothetical protein [Halosimplex amylolyticum]|uniref:hypothetical protein n=1 Tax=Halosimplex amylolyticum TaxID=3396616 RepID=UPI003F552724